MHSGRNFSLKEVIIWTRREIFQFLIISTIPTLLYILLDWNWLAIPWLPIALVGTAVAFLVGFKNNATYDRLWEARKIWGAIVNSSRSWGIMVQDFVSNLHAATPASEEELKAYQQQLIYRHIGWLTALRFQLRQARQWENTNKPHNREFRKYFTVPELANKMEDDLKPFLSPDERGYVLRKKNQATQILALQSRQLKDLMTKGLIDDFRHMEMEKMLVDFFTQQGKCERIKNFPYPRQFATLNLFFVWLFIVLVPFGMLQEFDKLGDSLGMGNSLIWLTIPFSAMVGWVFHTMDKIGESTENPFEGGANDIPMAALSRTIEIDLREMLDEEKLPDPIQAENNILM